MYRLEGNLGVTEALLLTEKEQNASTLKLLSEAQLRIEDLIKKLEGADRKSDSLQDTITRSDCFLFFPCFLACFKVFSTLFARLKDNGAGNPEMVSKRVENWKKKNHRVNGLHAFFFWIRFFFCKDKTSTSIFVKI